MAPDRAVPAQWASRRGCGSPTDGLTLLGGAPSPVPGCLLLVRRNESLLAHRRPGRRHRSGLVAACSRRSRRPWSPRPRPTPPRRPRCTSTSSRPGHRAQRLHRRHRRRVQRHLGLADRTGTPLDITANAGSVTPRSRPTCGTTRWSRCRRRPRSGNTTPARWVTALANGTYNVTVAVGDATAINSIYVITARGTAQGPRSSTTTSPTTAAPFSTQTKRSTVTNGQLVLAPTGGSNTKIDFVDATPVTGGARRLSVTSADTTTLGLSTPGWRSPRSAASPTPPPVASPSPTPARGTLTVTGWRSAAPTPATSGWPADRPRHCRSRPAARPRSASGSTPPTRPAADNNPTAIGNANRAATLSCTAATPRTRPAPLTSAASPPAASAATPSPCSTRSCRCSATPPSSTSRYIDRRYIGPARLKRHRRGHLAVLQGGQREQAGQPRADRALRRPQHPGVRSTGWYAQGAALPSTPTCSSACQQLWTFPADPSSSTYNQNQKLLPVPAGTTTFTPAGNFGVFSGDFSDVNFSDDSLNVDHMEGTTPNVPIPHYLHDLRVYQAYGPGHVAIPNTYLVGIDITRVPD